MAFFVGLLAWFREYGGPDGPSHWIYLDVLSDVRLIDLVLMGVVFVSLAAKAATNTLSIPRFHSKGMARGAVMFSSAAVIAFAYGAISGGQELFYDWRNIALGVLVGFVAYRASPKLLLLGLIVGSVVIPFGGLAVLHGRTTLIFDGPSVFALVLAAFLAPHFLGRRGYFISVPAGILVLLSWRRTYWAIFIFALLLIAMSRQARSRGKIIVGTGIFLLLAYMAVGQPFVDRIESFNPFTDRYDNVYSSTNPDHVGDILDAWDVVQEHPFLGIGLGRSYETNRIALWKEEAWDVHNAFLHVWLRYGLLGLVSYIVFHVGLFRWLWRRGGWPRTVGALWAGTFVMSVFTTWPYSGLQFTAPLFTLLGMAYLVRVDDSPAGGRGVMSGDSRVIDQIAPLTKIRGAEGSWTNVAPKGLGSAPVTLD